MSDTNGNLALVKVQTAPSTYSQADYVRWQIVGEDVTRDEFDYFISVAKHLNLDPLRRQIYCVKRGKKAVVQTGIDGYRVIAARTGELAGIDDVAFGPTDKEGHPTFAAVTVYRLVHGHRCPFAATARWQEYRQLTSSGALMPNWKSMPFLMLGKCAEALALRKAFPEALSGIYTDTELGTEVVGYQPQSQRQQQKSYTPQTPAGQEPPAQPPTGLTWPAWCGELAKRTNPPMTRDQYFEIAGGVTGKDVHNVKQFTDADWQKVAHELLSIIDVQEADLQAGLEEEDVGLAKMAGLDAQVVDGDAEPASN